MKCTACGVDMDERVNICPNCGKEYAECVQCGSFVESGMKLCKKYESLAVAKSIKSESKLKRIAVISVVVFVLAVIAIAVFSGTCLVITQTLFYTEKMTGYT